MDDRTDGWKVRELEMRVKLLEEGMRERVRRSEFIVVQKIVYSAVGLVLTSVLLAALAIVIKGST